jgi:serpin B
MTRLLAFLVALALAAGCSSGGGGTSPVPQPTAGVDGMTLAVVTAPRLATAEADGTAAGGAVNAFGLDLYARLVADDPAGNLVFSPASIELPLAMARAGARGQTASEMDAVMHDLGAEANAAWVAALDASLNDKTATFPDASGEPQEVILRSVNAPFAQRGMTIEPAYLDALAERWAAGLRLVDYIGNPEGSRGVINGWVNDQTEERIPELLAPGVITADTRLVLVNAIYLKAAWQLPFGRSLTAEAPFTRLDGSTMDVSMMHASGAMPYAAGEGWQAVDLGYVGGRLSMLVIVPDDLTTFEATFDAQRITAISDALESRQVRLGMPAFGTESMLDLNDTLKALGMPTAFDDNTADFSGMTSEERLYISAVVHQANIDVDEDGTEAAAATAVTMEATSAPVDDVELTVDRPFIFALRDLDTGAVLFLGRIMEPAVRS